MEERRLNPRYRFEYDVELGNSEGASYEARTTDLSAVGVGMLLSRDGVVGLAQGGSILTPGDTLWIRLPEPRGPDGGWLDRVSCRVKQVRRVSVDRYVVSIWFEGLVPNQQAACERLVAEAQKAHTKSRG
jgi:hypothetical protein